ncbi:MAG: 50S ribosomal protein L10 [Planctomycetaceae bacterium]
MSKRIKGMIIDEIRERIGAHRDLLVLDCSKLDGVTSNRLRLALRKQSIGALGVPNSLARRALSDAGVTGLDGILEGPSTLVFGGEDIVSLSKEIAKWAKDIADLEIKGGTVEGTALSGADVEKLSKSPSRLELISQIAGQLLSPGANLAAALLGPGAKLASQIEKIAEKQEEGGPPEGEAAA